MVQDKIDAVLKFAEKSCKTINDLFDKLIAKTDFINLAPDIKKRIISAVILIPIALYAIFSSRDLFVFLALAVTIIMTAEWLEITKSAQDQKKWRMLGFFYILIPIYATVKIRFYDTEILFWMFAIIWATDIFAFFAGKMLGGKKLAPQISPNKTWSGLAGGVIASALIGLVSSLMFSGSVFFFVFMSIFLSVVEQASDLLESKVKRIFGVKDSGNIIPGHGGVLDRLDGLMLVAPTVLLLITFFPNQFSS
jgi:phosphatidate cytidylyltransferase